MQTCSLYECVSGRKVSAFGAGRLTAQVGSQKIHPYPHGYLIERSAYA